MVPIDFNDEQVFELLKTLQDEEVQYLLIGGIAMMFHGRDRVTPDVDIWVKDTEQNIVKLRQVLSKLGMGDDEQVQSLELASAFNQFSKDQYGLLVEPMKNPKAFESEDFEFCYSRAVEIELRNVKFRIIHPEDLLKEKEAINRHKDQGDISYLKTLA